MLLLLHRDASRSWTAAQVSTELYTSLASAADRLADLRARGLLVLEPTSPPRFHYGVASEDACGIVNLLAETYRERPVTVIALVFAKPQDAIRDFADAFRLGKRRTDG